MQEYEDRPPRNRPIVPPSVEAGPGLRWEPDWGHWDDFWRRDEVRDIWDTHAGDVMGRAPSWYCKGNVIPRGSSIALRASVKAPEEDKEDKEDEDLENCSEDNNDSNNGCVNSSGDNEVVPESPWKFATAIIRSKTKVHFGYIEICARVRKSQISSGFWLSSNEDNGNGWWTGIDVFHYSSGRRNKFAKTIFTSTHVHRFGRDLNRKPVSRPLAIEGPDDFSDEIHRFAVDWTPQKITWYIDDEQVRTITNDYHHRPLNIILDSQTFPRWFGIPDIDDPRLPADFEVYYVRTWKRQTDLHEEDGIVEVVDPKEDNEKVSFKNYDWGK